MKLLQCFLIVDVLYGIFYLLDFNWESKFLRLLEESEQDRIRSYIQLKENVIATLMIALNNLLQVFRSNQSNYLKNIDSRKTNVENFFQAASSTSNTILEPILAYSGGGGGETWDSGDGFETNKINSNEELTIDQIQHIMQNEHMTKEREKEVNFILKKIKKIFRSLKSANLY